MSRRLVLAIALGLLAAIAALLLQGSDDRVATGVGKSAGDAEAGKALGSPREDLEKARQRLDGSAPGPFEPKASATATLVFEIVEKDTGSVVPNYPVVLYEVAAGWHGNRSAASDARGEARFEGMIPGRYFVLAPRWDGEVKAGEHRVRLELEHARDVTGVVVDDLGGPLPGAEVWTTRDDGFLAGAVLETRAGLGGRFRFVLRGGGGYVFARLAGHAPSRLVGCLEGVHAWERELRLVVGRLTATVTGTVQGGGTAMPGAWVWVAVRAEDLPGEPYPRDETYSLASMLPMPECRTSGDGTFTVEGVPPGRGRVRVIAEGWPPATIDYRAEPGAEAFVRVELTKGATLMGSVHRGDRPVPGVEISTGREFDRHGTETGEDGEFRLDCIPPGRTSAWARLDSASLDRRYLELADGQEAEWHIELPETARLAGRVVHHDGLPAADWNVRVDGGEMRLSCRTDSEGRFSIDGCPPHGKVLSAPGEAWWR